MQMILSADEYLSLRARAIGRKDYEQWKNEVFKAQNEVHNTIMGLMSVFPKGLKHQQAMAIKDVLGKLHEATSRFPFETLIKE